MSGASRRGCLWSLRWGYSVPGSRRRRGRWTRWYQRLESGVPRRGWQWGELRYAFWLLVGSVPCWFVVEMWSWWWDGNTEVGLNEHLYSFLFHYLLAFPSIIPCSHYDHRTIFLSMPLAADIFGLQPKDQTITRSEKFSSAPVIYPAATSPESNYFSSVSIQFWASAGLGFLSVSISARGS